MPGTTTTSSEMVTVRKTSLEGVSEWETCPQDSPSPDWGRERGDSMKSGSSKSAENGSVFSKSSTSAADIGSASASTSGTIETAKEAKEKEHMMKRTSSWMKNLGNGMRTLRLRKGSGNMKKNQNPDNSILDEDASISAKDVEVENVSPVSTLSHSESTASKTKSKSKSILKFKRNDDKKKSAAAVVSETTMIATPVHPVPEVVSEPESNSKSTLEPTPVVHDKKDKESKIKKRGNSASGQNGSPAKLSGENPDKTDPARFIGEGLCFKAKLIGVLEVSGPRGDRICQEALSELKMAVKAAGEHKQKVTIHVALDGLRLRDEKTGDCLYHHQVHKISFIAQDLTDTRAFGYIFGSPDTGHRFFGIKTEKSASQVVMAMRDLFQVVFDLKKKEIERAKQQLEMQQKFLATRAAETAPRSGYKSNVPDGACALNSSSAPAEADLLNLEVELNSLQEGLENIHSNLADNSIQNSVFNRGSTASISSDPMNPMSPGFKYSTISSNTNNTNSFANSQLNMPPIISNQSVIGNVNSFGDAFDPFVSKPTSGMTWPSPFASDPFVQDDPFAQVDPFPIPKFNSFESGGEFFISDPFESSGGGSSLTFTETGNLSNNSSTSTLRHTSQNVMEQKGGGILRNDSIKNKMEKIQELSNTTNSNGPMVPMSSSGWMASFEDNFAPQSAGSDLANGTTQVSGRTSANLDIFTELDPLGTGKMRPFVDRKDFFHDLKNPPKKVLNDLTCMPLTTGILRDQSSTVSLPSAAVSTSTAQQKVLQLPQGQDSTIHNSFSTHFNPSSTSSAIGGGGLNFESHFKLPTQTELRTSSIRVRLPSSSGGDSPPNYSPPPPPPSSSVSNSIYFINPPISQIVPSLGSGSRVKKPPGLLKHITISNTPTTGTYFANSSPKTLPRSSRLGKQFSTLDCSDEIPSLTPPPPPRPPPSSSATLTRNSTTAVPRPHSGNESRRQNYATLSLMANAPPEPPPRPLQTTIISDISIQPLVSPPPPLPPKKQTIGPTLSSSILGKLLYTTENLCTENEIRNDLPLPLPSRRSGNTNSISNFSSNVPRYALPAENSISSPILYNRKKMLVVEDPIPTSIPETAPCLQMTMDQALNQVASLSLGQLAGKLGLPVSELSYLTIHQLAEQLTQLNLRRNSDIGPTVGFPDSFVSNFDPDAEIDQNEFSTASTHSVIEVSKIKHSSQFDKYAVFRELTLEDASGFSMEEDIGGSKILTSMTSRDSSSERTLQADDAPDLDGDHPMVSTMDDITDVNFSDGDDEANDKSMLDDEIVDLNTKSEWATFESNFDEQFVPLSKSEESPWESDVEGDAEGGEADLLENAVIKAIQKRETSPRDQFDFVPFEKPPPIDRKRTLEEPKFQRQSSSSSKHSDRGGIPKGAHHGHGKTTTSDYSADSGKERPFSGSSSGRRYSRGGGESDEDWSMSHSANARQFKSHRHYHEEETIKSRKRDVEEDEADEDEDDRSHASHHSNSNSYSRERRHRRYHPQSSKYYDYESRHGASQSLQRHGRFKGKSARTGSPDRYSNHESDFEDSFEDEGVSSVSGRKRDYLREEYYSAGSRPSSSGSGGRRYPQAINHRDKERPDYHGNSYHPRYRYGHGHHNRHYRDCERDRDRGRGERMEEEINDDNASDFSEEGRERWKGPGKKIRAKRAPHSQPNNHISERDRDSKHRYHYNTNSPSCDSESPPPDFHVKKGSRRGSGGSGRPSSASHCHYNNSFVNTPPADERVSSSSRQTQGRGSSRYQSELSLNTSRKLSASEFRFEDESDKKRSNDEPCSLSDALNISNSLIAEVSSNTSFLPGQRPPESPFEDNFVSATDESNIVKMSENETNSSIGAENDGYFPTKFDFDSQAVEQIKMEEEEFDNSLDVSEKSVESLQETPPSTEIKCAQSPESEMKKSNSFNIFVRETDPFEDDDFFK